MFLRLISEMLPKDVTVKSSYFFPNCYFFFNKIELVPKLSLFLFSDTTSVYYFVSIGEAVATFEKNVWVGNWSFSLIIQNEKMSAVLILSFLNFKKISSKILRVLFHQKTLKKKKKRFSAQGEKNQYIYISHILWGVKLLSRFSVVSVSWKSLMLNNFQML